MSRLEKDNIQTKRYFYPPIHKLTVAKEFFHEVHLPKTEFKSSRVLALPIYSHMPFEEVTYVCKCVLAAYQEGK
jgi:dTDP-4-amino-4,6-dideoxygalactose transaminase